MKVNKHSIVKILYNLTHKFYQSVYCASCPPAPITYTSHSFYYGHKI
jgi:hypothetical protein